MDYNSISENTFPRTVTIKINPNTNYNIKFFESIAIPKFLLDTIYILNIPLNNKSSTENNFDLQKLKVLSQWKIAIPETKKSFNLTETQKRIMSVLNKILTRGRFTLTSPNLENKFSQKFLVNYDENENFNKSREKLNQILEQIYHWSLNSFSNTFDIFEPESNEENIFYNQILPQILGDGYKKFVHPQVNFSSLIPEEKTSESVEFMWVDFAIFHPQIQKNIIVEIDGKQHISQANYDENRDKTLQKNNYTVIRIPAEEVRQGYGEKISELKTKLTKLEKSSPSNENKNLFKLLFALKVAHQIQLTIFEAILRGIIPFDFDKLEICTDLNDSQILDTNEALFIVNEIVKDFVELLHKLSNLYSEKINSKIEVFATFPEDTNLSYCQNKISISFLGKSKPDYPTFYIQNIYFPFHIANELSFSEPTSHGINKAERDDLKYFLQYIFRKEDFWEGQIEGITRILNKKDALILLPTGAGKSLIYQLASMLLPGITIVVDPLIALMEDQVYNLNQLGIDRTIAISSQDTERNEKNMKLEKISYGEYFFVFVSPERFQIVEFRNSLQKLTQHIPVALIVIDEAHCVSEWGHDFRTSYLNIGRITREYCKSGRYVPPLIGLTGTASRTVLKDIQRILGIESIEAIITPKSFNRSELEFEVIKCKSSEKLNCLVGQLLKIQKVYTFNIFEPKGNKTHSGLIFCPHIEGKYGVIHVAQVIRKEFKLTNDRVDWYSGGNPSMLDYFSFIHHKRNVTTLFKKNFIPLLICTKAFGMGIDKPNIRYTIHYNLPPSIEAFYQEAGRAGRDKNIAYNKIIFSNDNSRQNEKLLDPTTPIEEIIEYIDNLDRNSYDDISRNLYFHTETFKGIEKEIKYIQIVLKYLENAENKTEIVLPIPQEIKNEHFKKKKNKKEEEAEKITEKAIYRLLTLGVVKDYTKDFNKKEFNVELTKAQNQEILDKYIKYVESYQYIKSQEELKKASAFLDLPRKEFIIKIAELLLNFLYEIIEKGRRRAIYEMLQACEIGVIKPEEFRNRILRYLESSEFQEGITKILDEKDNIFVNIKDLINLVTSPKNAGELRGTVSRFLESYPDNFALLMIRAISELLCTDKNPQVVRENFFAAIYSAVTFFDKNNDTYFEFISWSLSFIHNYDKELSKGLLTELIQVYFLLADVKKLIYILPFELGEIARFYILLDLVKKINNYLKGG